MVNVKSVFAAGLILAVAHSGPALAAPVTGKEAKKLVFSTDGVEVEMLKLGFLSASDSQLLEQVAEGYAYYAAIAVAPGEELLKSEATMLVANHHSTEAAAAAALEGCNAARTTPTPCELVALVRPKKWESRSLQLSVEATQALRSDYGDAGPRALAISAKSGFFALGKSQDAGASASAAASAAALAACAAKGADDCEIAVED